MLYKAAKQEYEKVSRQSVVSPLETLCSDVAYEGSPCCTYRGCNCLTWSLPDLEGVGCLLNTSVGIACAVCVLLAFSRSGYRRWSSPSFSQCFPYSHPFLCYDTTLTQRRDTVAQYLEADLEEFEQLQDVVKTYLNDNPTSKANVMYKSAAIYAPEKQSPLYEF